MQENAMHSEKAHMMEYTREQVEPCEREGERVLATWGRMEKRGMKDGKNG
jgi:hypothetical protein